MNIPCMYELDLGVTVAHVALKDGSGTPYSLCTKGVVVFLGGAIFNGPITCMACIAILSRRDDSWHAVFENMWDALSTSHGVAAPG